MKRATKKYEVRLSLKLGNETHLSAGGVLNCLDDRAALELGSLPLSLQMFWCRGKKSTSRGGTGGLRSVRCWPTAAKGFILLFLVLILFPVAAVETYQPFANDADLYPMLPSDQYGGAIIVKFHNDSSVTLSASGNAYFLTDRGQLRSGLAVAQAAFERFHARRPTPLFSRPVAALRSEHARAEAQAGRALPDLTTFYSIPVPDYADAGRLLAALGTNEAVEIAYAQSLPERPPTEDLTGYQIYCVSAATNGYDVAYARTQPGGDGANIRLIDVEYDWCYWHEDLLKSDSDFLWGTIYTNYGPDHGTAVLGISVALDNDYGMRGIIDRAEVKMIGCVNGGSYVVADAINQAVANTVPCDVILIEQQSSKNSVYCPVEYKSDIYSAIVNATALGRIVVEPAGNGSTNLDASLWKGIFDRTARDSGAIMVGAGAPADRSRLSFSDYGSRVDIQGWGYSVATLGIGDLAGSTPSNSYTAFFSGTSSASALSAAVAASVQSHVRAIYGVSLTPFELRSNLVQNGYAQTFGLTGNIGPQPNLSNSYVAAEAYLESDADGDGMKLWQERIAGTDPNDGASVLRMGNPVRLDSPPGLVLAWQSVTNRFYTLECSTNQAAAPAFYPLLEHVAGQAGTTTCTDVTAAVSSPCFYRVRVEP